MGFFSSLFKPKKTPEEIRKEKRQAELQQIKQQIQALRAKADAGDIAAILELADIYRRGVSDLPLQESREEGARWFEKAANMGSAQAMRELGGMYDHRSLLTVRADAAAALYWYEKACLAGEMRAAVPAGKLCLDGEGIEKDPQKARQFFEMAVNASIPEAAAELGKLYERGKGVEKDMEKARLLYEKGAALGSAYAELCLGDVYYFARGVEQDFERAAAHYRAAKQKNISAAGAMLDRMMLFGQIPLVGSDHDVFRHLLRLSDGFSRDRAGYTIGLMLELGHCVDQNYDKAMEYYEISAKAGYTPAMAKICNLELEKWEGHDKPDTEKIRYWGNKLIDLEG